MTAESVATWQKRLEDTFAVNGLVGGRFIPSIYEAEQLCGNKYAHTFAGHICLSDCFIDFFATTLRMVTYAGSRGHWPKDTAFYPIVIADFTSIFQTFRSTTNLAINGYPLEAFSLQRTLFEQALIYGAVVNGYITFQEAWGLDGLGEVSSVDDKIFEKWRKKRISAEKTAVRKMIGAESGLTEGNQVEIKKLFDLFHQQVHRSFVSVASMATAWNKDGKAPSVIPTFVEQNYAIFMNRHTEIGWMLLRCLPTLFHEAHIAPEKWKSDFSILDQSFRVMVEGLQSINKKIASATIELIDRKFAFAVDRIYKEK